MRNETKNANVNGVVEVRGENGMSKMVNVNGTVEVTEVKENKTMREKEIDKKLAALAALGIDPQEFVRDVVVSEVEKAKAKEIVGDDDIENIKVSRRWICAQTFRMLNYKKYIYNYRLGGLTEKDAGWYEYLRDMKNYQYQFSMLQEELKVLARLEKNDPEEFKLRTKFFNRNVVNELIKWDLHIVEKYIAENSTLRTNTEYKYGSRVTTETEYVGYMEKCEFHKRYVAEMNSLASQIRWTKKYSELYTLFCEYNRRRFNGMDKKTRKCPVWVEAYQGAGAYYSLDNIIRYHGCKVRGCYTKDASLRELDAQLKEHVRNGELWKLHYMLKDVIAHNNFDLARSIKAQKREIKW